MSDSPTGNQRSRFIIPVHHLQFLGCSLVWSVSFLLMKKAVVGFNPLAVGAWRVIGGAAMLGWLCWRRSVYRSPSTEESAWLMLVALLGCGWPYAIQPAVVGRQGSAFVALSVSLVPLFTLGLSTILLGVYPARRQLVGVVGAFGCLTVLLVEGLSRSIPVSDMLLAGSVPFCYAISNIIIRRRLSHFPPLGLTFLALSVTALILFPASWTIPQPVVPTAEEWWWGAAALAVLGILGTGLATYWFNSMIQSQGPLFAGMSTNLVPLGALVWGWWDAEQVTGVQVCALLGIVSMVILVQWGAAPPVMISRAPGD